MNKWEMVQLGDICIGTVTNIAQKDLTDNNGNYPIYGASGFIKNVNFYKQEKPYIAVIKDGAGVGRVSRLPAKSSVIGTMQYILPNDNVNVDFLYHLLSRMNLARYYTGATIPHIYFKDYKKEFVPFPPLLTQKKIADVLDRVNSLMDKRRRQIEKLDLLVKAQFVGMFGDPVTNKMEWIKKTLITTCNIITGNTPPRANLENFGDYIEWIKTDNIQTANSNLTPALEYLSRKGFEKCRYVETNSILMTCIAGSLNSIGNVAITDRRVAFNQQINALIPKEYNNLFLYWLLKMMKSEICGAVNMMLKGILSKGNLSNIEAIVPPIPLQTRFADFVKQVDKTKFDILKNLTISCKKITIKLVNSAGQIVEDGLNDKL